MVGCWSGCVGGFIQTVVKVVCVEFYGKVNNKGQVTIPVALRRSAGIKTGDFVHVIVKKVIDGSSFESVDEYGE
ncbi:AbrB/MazE/SpoVT family DNA-binding domain-containing protein [Methanothermobacter thermautotrophicus]|uniref:AbrB/MazE/SpoVT family DNA-binding domain-containing protein n=1 Tax=Methanothermobacter thermautotrophicus TaxID=145262 RepID=UPI003A4C5F0C